MPRQTRTVINAQIKPLSDALLRQGRNNVTSIVCGYSVTAYRSNSVPGRIGPAWNPAYRVDATMKPPHPDDTRESVSVPTMNRESLIGWLFINAKDA